MNQNINNQTIGYICAFLATLFWSGNFIIARDIKDIIEPISLSFYRWFLATILLLPFAIVPVIKNFVIIKQNFIYLSIISILGVSLFNTLIYTAAQTSSAFNLSIISITFPIIIILLSRIIYKEKINLHKIIGIFIVILGVLILITKGNLDILINITFKQGDIWVLLAAISFAIYSILLRYKPKEFTMLSFQLTTFLIGTAYLSPIFFLQPDLKIFENLESKEIISLTYVAVFASILAFILWNKSIEIIGANKAAMIYYSLPILTGILGYIYLNEDISLNHIVSLILIVLGIVMTNKKEK